GSQCHRISLSAQQKGHRSERRNLWNVQINFRLRFRAQSSGTEIADNSNNLAHGRVAFADADAGIDSFTNGVFARESPFRKAFVDDRYRSRSEPVTFCVFAPLSNRDSKRTEEIRPDKKDARVVWILSARRIRPSLNAETGSETAIAQRHRRGRAIS